MITAFVMSTFANNDLSSDPVYQERLAAGHVVPPREKSADFHLKTRCENFCIDFLDWYYLYRILRNCNFQKYWSY